MLNVSTFLNDTRPSLLAFTRQAYIPSGEEPVGSPSRKGFGRRTGVGITAEGDMIAAMGLRYGTQEATDFSVEVHKTLALNAYRSSVEMAKERGAFEIFDAKREQNNPFILRIKEADPALYSDMVKYGRRNIACLTIPRLNLCYVNDLVIKISENDMCFADFCYLCNRIH